MRRPMLLVGLLVSALLVAPVDTRAETFSERVGAALDAESRTPEERARDSNRKPVETLD